jgi:hypothetical protein
LSAGGQPRAWTVLKAADVSPYRVSTGSGESGQFISDLSALAEADGRVEITPGGRAQLAAGHPAIVFRHTTKNDNSRTLIAAALPAAGYLPRSDYVHAIQTGQAPPRDQLALLGCLNSITADWWVRRFVDRAISARDLEAVRLPGWSPEQRAQVADRVAELLIQNGVRDLPGGLPIDQRRPHEGRDPVQLHAEIDVLVLAGFGLGPAHLETILADFSQSQAALPPAYRQLLRVLLRAMISGQANQPARDYQPGPEMPADPQTLERSLVTHRTAFDVLRTTFVELTSSPETMASQDASLGQQIVGNFWQVSELPLTPDTVDRLADLHARLQNVTSDLERNRLGPGPAPRPATHRNGGTH